MADTAHTDPEMMVEFEQPEEVIRQSARQLAEWIRGSRHFIVFTGAGISTSCGIPDFRGPDGVWTLRAKGEARKGPTTSTLKAIPSFTHMALLTLQRRGLLRHLISQNTDGLHRRSGIDVEHLSELHGNSNLERCSKCGKEYLRDFRVRTATKVHEHTTGNRCGCGGALRDTIINFGENLPEAHLRSGFANAAMADLCLCLGSSLTVTPAADMPREVPEHGGRLVICNLQKTPLDSFSALRIHARCDTLMRMVMEELELEVPAFKLARTVRVSVKDSRHVLVEAIDADGTPASIFGAVEARFPPTAAALKVEKEPFRFRSPAPDCPTVVLTLHFMGHYAEPSFRLPPVALAAAAVTFHLQYDPSRRAWARLADDGTFVETVASPEPAAGPAASTAGPAAAPAGLAASPASPAASPASPACPAASPASPASPARPAASPARPAAGAAAVAPAPSAPSRAAAPSKPSAHRSPVPVPAAKPRVVGGRAAAGGAGETVFRTAAADVERLRAELQSLEGP